MKQRSVMQHQFSEVPRAEIPRSSFDRSHGHKTTFDAGLLVPILLDEALPGDTFTLNMTGFARLATPIFPLMDNMYMETFFFAVPNRLLWDNWQKFCGEQTDPGDSIDFTVPIYGTGITLSEGDLGDYLGLPINFNSTNSTDVNCLATRAYRLIYNEWFRDENLQDSLANPTDDGPDSNAQSGLTDVPLRRGKRHDYFTSALPWPQKGAAGIAIPLGTVAPITGLGVVGAPNVGSIATIRETGASVVTTYADAWNTAVSTDVNIEEDVTVGATADYPGVFANLSAATAGTINQLRQAFQIQKLLERDARAGTRYTEIVKSHFGVTSPDARLQRPEFLGGGSSPIVITPIANTSDTATAEQGQLAGYGVATLMNHGFTKSFTEHCIIIGLVSVRADLTYSQGINRQWNRSTRYDYFWPALSTIGEQTILNKEIWSDGSANDELVFGYQERYAEYRYKPSQLTGLMRVDATGTLSAWHLSQDFATLPVLDSTFIQDTPPVDRVIAVPTEPHFIFDSHFAMRCARPMPLYGVPGLIDHF